MRKNEQMNIEQACLSADREQMNDEVKDKIFPIFCAAKEGMPQRLSGGRGGYLQ